MSIALMTGSNLQMSKLATVATDLDGTSSTTSSYEYACPDVSPNAPIYFLVRTQLAFVQCRLTDGTISVLIAIHSRRWIGSNVDD